MANLPINIFAKAEEKQAADIANATKTSLQIFEENLKILSQETLNAISQDMKLAGEELKDDQQKLVKRLHSSMIDSWQEQTASTLSQYQQNLDSQLTQLANFQDEIETTRQHIHTLKTQAEQVIYSQSDLTEISQRVQNTAEQVYQSAMTINKAKKGIITMAGIAGIMAVVIGLMSWQAVRQSTQLATVKAELARYGSQASMTAKITQQTQVIEQQQGRIQQLESQIAQSPETAERIKTQQEQQHQLAMERLKMSQEQQMALIEARKAQQEAQAEARRKRAEQQAEAQRKAEEQRAQAEQERLRQCQDQPNRFLCD